MNRLWACLTVVLLIPASSTEVSAGGVYLYEQGTIDLGFAGAGSAARASDASTVYANPAGMSRLSESEIAAGAQALYGGMNYMLEQGEGPGNVVGWQPAGSFFYSQQINEDLKAGLGLYSNAGLSLDFGNDWKGQSLLDKASLMFITLQPTAAWKVTDAWSVGGGLTVTQGRVKLTSGTTRGGTQLVNESDIDYGYGVRLGVMYTFNPDVRLGLAWSSEQRYDFNINRSVTNSLTGQSLLIEQAHLRLPQQVMASFWYGINESLALAGNVGWQQWSRFADNHVSSSVGSINSTLNLQDTWHVALGGQYRLTDSLRLNGGVAYDSSWNKNDDKGSLTWPSSQAWRFATGLQYILSESSEVGVAVEYLQGNTLKDDSPVFGGEYKSPYMVFIAAQYVYRF